VIIDNFSYDHSVQVLGFLQKRKTFRKSLSNHLQAAAHRAGGNSSECDSTGDNTKDNQKSVHISRIDDDRRDDIETTSIYSSVW
jgi:hypothetical protein